MTSAPKVGLIATILAVGFGAAPAFRAWGDGPSTPSVTPTATHLGAPESEAAPVSDNASGDATGNEPVPVHKEVPDDPYVEAPRDTLRTSPPVAVERNGYVSVQVNTDPNGYNIFGDAANEPTLAVDPTNRNRLAIGWRQFDTVYNNFRQSGWASSADGGATWPYAGVHSPGVFGSDPVLAFDADGGFYFVNINSDSMNLFKSDDGGVTWSEADVILSGFHDKEWLAIDRTNGIGRGNMYLAWTEPEHFTRSTDGGNTWMAPIATPLSGTLWGTLTVNPDGELFMINGNFAVAKSVNAQDPEQTPTFEVTAVIDLGGTIATGGVNPVGLDGQAWIAVDRSDGPHACNLYALCSVDPPGPDPLDVKFSRSTDGGYTWSAPLRVNDDDSWTNAWQWFGTLCVAPGGRIDVFWYDTREDSSATFSEVYYSYSEDGGVSFSPNEVISPPFNHYLGYPQQDKLGDYCHCISDDVGVGFAYAATFNGEQDVYYIRIGDLDCNGNGVADSTDILEETSFDCNFNGIPDECETDCNGNGLADECDIADETSLDCNSNGIPDECEADCNVNGIPDDCDITAGTSLDEDDNGCPDECALLFVKPDATGAKNGTSWADALTDLPDALVPARHAGGCVTEIWLARGVYTPGEPDEKTATFSIPGGVAIYGGFVGTETTRAQRDPQANITTLSGDLAGDDGPDFANNEENAYHVVTALGTGENTILDGFHIVGGHAADPGSVLGEYGGGLYLESGQLTVRNCVFTANEAVGPGGAISAREATLTVVDCVFVGNTSSHGGACYTYETDATIAGSLFSGNTAGFGGALDARTEPTVVNSTFSHNTAANYGGGIRTAGIGVATLADCVFWGNTDLGGSDESAQIDAASPTVNYCCIQGLTGGFGGTGNIGLNPQFVDADGVDDVIGTADDDAHLSPGSPSIDAGDPGFVPVFSSTDLDGHARVLCNRVDMGAYESGIGDSTCDGAIDLADYASWPSCMTGPNAPGYPPGCESFDFDGDEDVDLDDFAEWVALGW
jgi:predicted outer membrane repeat protein